MCSLAAERWPELDAAYYQINLASLPAYRFANLVYAWAIERVPQDKMDEWQSELIDLLPWQNAATSDAAADIESASFFAAMNKQQG